LGFRNLFWVKLAETVSTDACDGPKPLRMITKKTLESEQKRGKMRSAADCESRLWQKSLQKNPQARKKDNKEEATPSARRTKVTPKRVNEKKHNGVN